MILFLDLVLCLLLHIVRRPRNIYLQLNVIEVMIDIQLRIVGDLLG